MEVHSYKYPPDAYPRYNYFSCYVDRLISRFTALMKRPELYEDQKVPKVTNGKVEVLLVKSAFLNHEMLPVKQSFTTGHPHEVFQVQSMQEVIQKKNISPTTPIILVVPVTSNQNVDILSCLTPLVTNVVFIVEKEEALQKKQSDLCGVLGDTCETTTAKGLGTKICDLLERMVFRNVLNEIQLLQKLYNFAKSQRTNGIVYQITKTVVNEIAGVLGHVRSFQGWQEEMFVKESHTVAVKLSEDVKSKPPPSYLDNTPAIKALFEEKHKHKCYLLYRFSVHLCKLLGVTVEEAWKVCNESLLNVPGNRHTKPDLSPKTESENALEAISRALGEALSEDEWKSIEDGKLEEMQVSFKMKKAKISTEIRKHIREMHYPSIMNRYCDQIAREEDNLHRMLWEADALMKESIIPEHERPFKPFPQDPSISPTLARKLLHSFSSIRGIGYRHGRLNVHVKEMELNTSKTIEKEISKVLRQYEVGDYDIVPVLENVKLFREVGAKVSPDRDLSRYGTLGGFAYMNNDRLQSTLCALMSKHVVFGSTSVYVDQNGNGTNTIEIGNLIQGNSGNGRENFQIDIAAAKVVPQEVHNCKTQFKNSKQSYRTSRLFNSSDSTRERPVHIYGAATKLGRGRITMSDYITGGGNGSESELQHLIVIEDEDPYERFCVAGDSGSIVCSDTPADYEVLVLSMVIGCIDYDEMEQKEEEQAPAGASENVEREQGAKKALEKEQNKMKRHKQYLTLRMDKGLEYLNEQSDCQFSLP